MVERLSTDIEWLVEIHCSSDDRSGRSVHRFIILLEDFIIYSDVSTHPRFIKHPVRDACLCMGELQAPAAPPAPHFVFLITL